MHKKLKITFNAPITLGFVMICFIATLLGVISNGKITQTLFMTYHSSLTNPMTYLSEYSRAVTPQIRQAGNRLSGLAETAYVSLLA